MVTGTCGLPMCPHSCRQNETSLVALRIVLGCAGLAHELFPERARMVSARSSEPDFKSDAEVIAELPLVQSYIS